MQDARCGMQDVGCRMQFFVSCLLLVALFLLLLFPFFSPLSFFPLPLSVRPTVKIGLVAPFEGGWRYVGYDVIYAVRLALREANAAGGVGGYSVELVAYDDGADPAMAVEQVRKLSADREVVAAIGHFREETTGAASSVYVEAGIPLVAPAVLDRALTWEGAEVYRLGPADGMLARALLSHVRDGHEVVLVSDGGPLGAALVEVAQQQHVTISAVVSPDTVDWVGGVLASGVDMVICDTGPVTAGEVATTLRGAGWEGYFLGGPELASTDFAVVAGRAAEGAVFVTPWPFPADVPGSDETGFFLRMLVIRENLVSGKQIDFTDAYRAVSNGVSPGPLALPAYEATWVLLEAVERDIAAYGVPTREGVGAALEMTQREGLLGRITFDTSHNWGDAPLYWYCIGEEGVPECVP